MLLAILNTNFDVKCSPYAFKSHISSEIIRKSNSRHFPVITVAINIIIRETKLNLLIGQLKVVYSDHVKHILTLCFTTGKDVYMMRRVNYLNKVSFIEK